MHRPIIPPPLPRFISPGAAGAATAIVTLLVAGAAWPIRGHGANEVERAPTERVRYLLPLLPPRVPVQSIHIDWTPGGRDVIGIDVAGTGEGSGGGGPHGGGLPAVAMPAAPAVTAPTFSDSSLFGGTVYVESQTDQPVVRDPTSAAPAYPPSLQQQHVEGSVTVSFVVDTSGSADSSSMRVREVTHPLFAEAVRAALPGMRFQPAQLGGRRVRQLVIQEFRFVLPRTEVVHGSQRPLATRPPTTD
jgi:TonB family protein